MMEYSADKSDTDGLVYQQIQVAERESYDAWIGRVTRETMLEDMHQASRQALLQLPMLVRFMDSRTGRDVSQDPELDTYTAEVFYLYAFEGDPRFLKHYVGGQLQEQSSEELATLDFAFSLSNFLSYNELFAAFTESRGGAAAYSLPVVLNTFVARMRLDVSAITGNPEMLSIHEVALLAGMKEKSVRNVAHKEIGAAYNQVAGMTEIRADNALAWLQGRRKFTPSVPLQNAASRDALVGIYHDFFER